MRESQSTLPNPLHTVYCAACNRQFFQKIPSALCPQCGGLVVQVSGSELLDTAIMGGPEPPGEVGLATVRDCIFLPGDLTGRELHVYRCESLLGAGGMGRVYLATHRDLGRQCALKILSPRVSDQDVDYVQRFQQEGRAAAGLIHPNIVTVHAIGESEGTHFLEMEFVAGQTLQQLIAREGRFAPVRATVLATEIAQGLAAAHRQGIVHRDLKAENVLLTHQGTPKIVDFGLAKRVRDRDGVPSGRIVGTPHYMAPELYQGRECCPRSDVYALGVCYFLMLTGKHPYHGDSFHQMRQAVETHSLPNVRELAPDIPLEMAECVALLLEKSPANRPASAMQALQLLQAVLGQMRDLESLLIEAFGDDPTISWKRTGSQYQILFTFPDGRRQRVFMEPTGQTVAEKLVMIYSTCCQARPDYYEQALRLNAEVPHGGLAIRDIDDEPYFVMMDTYPRGAISADAVRRSVREVATRADHIEHRLTGHDVH